MKKVPRDTTTGQFLKQLVKPSPVSKKQVTGLAFSGAGAKILFECGAAMAIRDLGIKPDLVIGTSSGAITSAFFASNQLDELETMCRTISNKDIYRWRPWNILTSKASLLDNTPLRQLLLNTLDFDAIVASKQSVLVNITSLNTWQDVEWDLTKASCKEEMVNWIIQSTSVPIAFPLLNNMCDGGIVNNYPIVNCLGQELDRIIIIVPSTLSPSPINGIKDLIGQLISISLYNQWNIITELLQKVYVSNSKIKLSKLDVIQPGENLNIPLLNIDSLSLNQRQRVIDLGYNLTMQILKR